MTAPLDFSVYLVTDTALCGERGLIETVRQAVAGGVSLVQYRDKDATTARRIETGKALMDVLSGTGVPLIVNDDIEAAYEIGAAGIHIGQDDTDPVIARAALGIEAIIGLSVRLPQEAAAIHNDMVDYVGAGPIFATTTKPDHPAPIGFEGLARVVEAAGAVPVVAIGGVKASHAGPIRRAGGKGLAFVSAICGADDPAEAARELKRQWNDTQ